MINRLADFAFSGNTFSFTLPPQSITLLVVPQANGNQTPVAVMSAAPTSGIAPLLVSFDGSSSSDADGTIVSHQWSFGDGATGSGSATSHTYTTPGAYNARLTVTDNQGASAHTTVTISVNANLPVAPSNLAATAVSATQINLAWTDNAANETGFKIERCAGSTCTSFAQIATVGANVKSYANAGLKRNTTYRYRVRAYNASGNSGYSNTASATTPRK